MFIDLKDPEILEKSWTFFLKSIVRVENNNTKKYIWLINDLYFHYIKSNVYPDSPSFMLQYETWLWKHRVGLVKDTDRLWLRFYKESDITWFILKCT